MAYNKLLLLALIACSANAMAQTSPCFKPFAKQFQTAEAVTARAITTKGITNVDPDDMKTLSAPTNVRLNDMQTKIRMTWDAVPADAFSGGTIDPAKVKYTIYTEENDSESEDGVQLKVLGEVVGETQFDIPANTDEGEPWVTIYGVTAEYEGTRSARAQSDLLAIGKPYTLPFTESFKNGNTDNFWWADCKNADDYGMLTDASLKSADGDNGCFGFMGTEKDTECTLVSHKISLAGATNPVVSFCQYYNSEGNVPLTLEVVKPDGSSETVETITASNVLAQGWRTKYAPLAKFASERYVVLRFHFKATTAKVLTGIDNIAVRNEKQNDLAVSMSAPKKVVKGKKIKLSVTVENLSSSNSPAFTLSADFNGTVRKSAEKGGTIKAFKKKTYNIEYATSAIDAALANMPVKVQLDAAEDADPTNNSAEATVELENTWRNGVENLSAEMDGNTARLTWLEPKANAKVVSDGFEDYEPWSTAFGEWTLVDVDKATTGGVYPNSDYPHEGEPFAFIVMNPSDIGEELYAHSGNQFLGAPYPYYDAANENYYPDADEWLISPELSGKEQIVKFWAKNLRTKDYNGNWQDNDEIFYFLGSKTDTSVKSFTDYYNNGITHKFDVYGGDWTEYSVRIAEGTKYFGIHHTTPGTEGLMLMLDDFSFEQGGTAAKYNVYRDGKLIGSYSGTSCTVSGNEAGEHSFAVTAVYADGSESAPAYVSGTAGIGEATTWSAAADKTAYTIGGIKAGKAGSAMKYGLYIVNGKKVVIK